MSTATTKPEVKKDNDRGWLIFHEREHNLKDIIEISQREFRSVPLELLAVRKTDYQNEGWDLIVQEIKIPGLGQFQDCDSHYSYPVLRHATLRQIAMVAQAQGWDLSKVRLCHDWVNSDYVLILYK